MNNLLKKSLAALMAILMVLSVAQFAVFAGDGDTTPPAEGNTQTGEGAGTGSETPADPGSGSGSGGETPADPGVHTHHYNAEPDVAEVQPTCTTAGHGKGWTCTVPGCGYVKYEAGNYGALGHLEEVIPAVAATCTEKGKTEGKKCSRPGCGAILVAPTETNALGHEWGAWTVVKESKSCNEQGEKQRHCTRTGCDAMEYELYYAAEHQWENVAAVNPTCTTAGAEAGKKCKNCGKVEGCASVAPTGHSYEKISETKADCENAGKTTYKCKKCGDLKDDNIVEALGHKLVDDPAVPATCQKEGKTAGRHCERCKKVFIEQTATPKADHDWEITPAIAPTCTEKGRTEGKKCKVCGYEESVSQEVAAKGHNFTTEVVNRVTCTANGLTKKYCTECNLSETIVVPATGHNLGDWVYEENFTCENGGERYKVCANCGETFEREQLPPQGHDWSKEWTIDTEATCTSKGYKSHHCTRCDKKNDITTIPKLPHSYQDKITKATTKRDGLVTGMCAVCGAERKPITVKRVKSFQLSKTKFIYDGKAKKPTVIVKDVKGNKLKKDTDYKVTYASGRKQAGTYTVKVTLIGRYSGSKKLKFSIVLGTPKGLEAKTNSAKGTIKLTCDVVKGAKKYVVFCSTEKDGGYKKLAVVKKPACTITTLEPGTYFFKVRAMTTNNQKKNAYSAYSAPLKVKLAKAK